MPLLKRPSILFIFFLKNNIFILYNYNIMFLPFVFGLNLWSASYDPLPHVLSQSSHIVYIYYYSLIKPIESINKILN